MGLEGAGERGARIPVMHLGLNWSRGDDWGAIRDLGVTWAKVDFTLGEPLDLLVGWLEAFREHDLIPVVDFRVDPMTVGHTMAEIGKSVPQSTVPDHPALLVVMGDIKRRMRKVVERCAGLCSDWEIMGEFSCPIVTRGALHTFDYLALLAFGCSAVKEVNAAFRVWLGGNGVWLSRDWLREIIQPEKDETLPEYKQRAGEFFSVCNWHHYGHTVDPVRTVPDLETQLAGYEEMFTEARVLLDTHSLGQPFASTEWGLPMCLDREVDRIRHSQAYEGGVWAVGESDAVDWFEQSLACFARYGFRVLCIHSLQDIPAYTKLRFWGGFCGCRREDGTRRPCWEVVQRYAWAARDSGEPAFQ